MITVKIKSIAIQNFKGIAQFQKCFNALSEEIRARNGAGKSTLMYAWQWVLGMDVPDVIPRLNNSELHNLETKVEAGIDIDGLSYQVCRIQTEEWKTNRETGIEEKHTNTCTYAIDGVGFSLKNFKDKLAQLFGTAYEKLEMLTNKDAFNTDKPPKWTWTARRKELFELSNTQELIKCLSEKSDYELIAEDIKKGFTTTEIRKAKLKALEGIGKDKDRNITLVEDKQNDISKYGAIDFAALEAQKAGYEAKITELNLLTIKQDQLGDKAALKAKIDALISERTQLLLADGNEKARLKNVADSLSLKKQLITRQANDLKAMQTDVEDFKRRIAEKESLSWHGETTCPTCGQNLPLAIVAKARLEWQKAIEADIAILRERAVKGLDQNDSISAELNVLRKTYKELEAEESLAIAELDNFTPSTRIPALDTEIAAIKMQTAETPAVAGEELYHAELLQTKNRLTEIQSQLAYKQVVADLKARVEELKVKNRELTDTEMVLKATVRALDAYVSEQVSLITDSINALFTGGISFALFTEQYAGAESELKETCICMWEGKIYSSLSTGERFRANLNVTQALQRAYGVSLPLFCDNAECFTGALDNMQEQVIRLCASAGEELENCIQVQKGEA